MVLADTSVWIDHLRCGNSRLVDLLSETQVLMHSFVAGELACGTLKDRNSTLRNVQDLPVAVVASQAEVMWLMEERRLWGRGLGWIDANLLASCLLSRCRLWTLDVRLAKAAAELGVG
jgi:predicted nucleic acid-binding protein